MPKEPQTKRTILVVDDQKSDREAARRALEHNGYCVLEAADYWEALNLHSQHLGEIDLLLTAIALPGTNGYELARTIFRVDPDLKVLFVSGLTGTEVSRFYNMPTSGPHILPKPLQPVDLLTRVNKILRPRARRQKNAKAAG